MHICANPAEANGGAAKVDCSAKNTSADTARQNRNQAAIIRAELVGSDVCTAESHTAHGAAPILSLCRKLIEAGVDPDRPLHAYRSDALALIVHSLGAGARLTVAEGDRKPPHLRQWKAWRSVEGSPPVDFNASDHAGAYALDLKVEGGAV